VIAELHVLLNLRAQQTQIGNFYPAIKNWVNCNNTKKDLIVTLFIAHFRGERVDNATLMQNLEASRNTISKYLKDGVSLGIFETIRKGNTNFYCGSNSACDEFLLLGVKERSLMSVQERKLLVKIFRNFSTRTVERKSLGLKTAQAIMLHIEAEFLQHTVKVRRGEMEPQDSPFLVSYQADWIPYRFSSSITGDLIMLALKAKSLSSPINLSEIKETLNTSMNTLRKNVQKGVDLKLLETEIRGREILVQATDRSFNAFFDNIEARFLTLGPLDLNILAEFHDI
jgi:transcriptional antiterminator